MSGGGHGAGKRSEAGKKAGGNLRSIRREIANSNERRRMQSINVGFDDLKALIPRHTEQCYDKLSKASILQASADYIRQLQEVRDRLLVENRMLRSRLGEGCLDDCMVNMGALPAAAAAAAAVAASDEADALSGRRRAESGVFVDEPSDEESLEAAEPTRHQQPQQQPQQQQHLKQMAAAAAAAVGSLPAASYADRAALKVEVTVEAAPAAAEQTSENLHTIIQAMKRLEGDAFSPAVTPRRPRSPVSGVATLAAVSADVACEANAVA